MGQDLTGFSCLFFNSEISHPSIWYNITINNPSTGQKLENNFTVVPRIIGNKNVSVYYGSDSYKPILLDDEGNYCCGNEIALIKIAGITHKVKTNEIGQAILKMKFNPKSYVITVEYKGYKVSNKITIKPILSAKNISKKKTKKIKYQAKLLNSKGKANVGKKLIFKIKGKTYSAKTNSKGIATVYLKNLKVGKYSIVVKYSSISIKKTMKIKK